MGRGNLFVDDKMFFFMAIILLKYFASGKGCSQVSNIDYRFMTKDVVL